jgi:calcium-dependent protein kinase
VCQLSSKQEQEQLYESFKALDVNNDGKLTKKELIIGYARIYPHLGEAEVEEEVSKLFNKADSDRSGAIDYSEWQIATINKYSILQDQKLKSAFELFDKDKNGSISASEIKAVLGVGKKLGNE